MCVHVRIQALRSNKRVDGLYLYVNTSSPLILGSRQKERLAEAASTLDKRLTWTKQQVAKSQSPGLFDVVITNTEMQEVSHLGSGAFTPGY